MRYTIYISNIMPMDITRATAARLLKCANLRMEISSLRERGRRAYVIRNNSGETMNLVVCAH